MMNTTYTQFQAPVQVDAGDDLACYMVTAFCPKFGADLIVAKFVYDEDSPDAEHYRAQAELLATEFYLDQTTIKYPTGVRVPILDRDRKYPPHKDRLTEYRVVANLIDHLGKVGFKPVITYDGGERIKVQDMKSTMETVFSVDQSTIYFQKEGGKRYGVLIVCGNGYECVADWAAPYPDSEGFSKAMDAFDFEQFNPHP